MEDAAVVEPFCAIRSPTRDMVSLHQTGKTVTFWFLTERLTSAIKLLQLGQALADLEGMMPEAAEADMLKFGRGFRRRCR